MNKEQLIEEIAKLKEYENETSEMRRDMHNRNSIKFANILPNFKYIKYRNVDSSFYDFKYDICFKNGPSIIIDVNGNIQRCL